MTFTLADVFTRQRGLMIEFNTIEAKNGLLKHGTIPLDIHSKSGQARARELAWRTVEEIGEALSADTFESREAFQEEVADVFHFVVELMIAVGFDAETLQRYTVSGRAYALSKPPFSFKEAAWLLCITELTTAMNCLKNKPWSLKERAVVNPGEFHTKMRVFFESFITAAASYDIYEIDLIQGYMRKAEINDQRLKDYKG